MGALPQLLFTFLVEASISLNPKLVTVASLLTSLL